MDGRRVCLSLLAAESETDVQAVIDSTPYMSVPDNWKPLDNRETNFNVTSNQASDGGKALTELMTNMVDAVLTKHAYLKGIDPRGKDAPPTMYEAVDRLIKNLRGGRLVNLDPKDPWLRDFAQKNLIIGITGAKTKKEGLPCYTFVDNGEGQNPEDFGDTFLSLSAGNKKSIPFVQGKYNMGSSGVLRYCGRRWFKLIVSRRYDGEGPWGWTLMRRRPDDGDNMPVAEYFILPSGEIPSFESDILYPFKTIAGRRYDGVTLRTGTVVKLYDYQVGSKFLSFRGARDTLNENLVETILPFRLLDFRQLPKTKEAREAAKKRGGERAEGIDPRPFYGMEFLLLRSHKEEGLEDEEDDAAGQGKIFVGNVTDDELGRISVSAIPLKGELPGWLKYSNNRVFHTVNGQVQFKQTRGFLSQTCGFPALKDRVVVIVNASRLTFAAHNEVWKGDREHISNTIVGERYLEKVTTTIKESEALKALQNRIAQQELERATQAESNALFQKLVDADRNLARLLSNRDPSIRLPAAGGEGSGAESGAGDFDGKYSPTFIRLEERFAGSFLDLPVNRSRPVAARTDAENGYLNRAENTGRVIINEEILKLFGIREHLHNGRLVVYLEPDADRMKIGDTFSFGIGLHDDAMPAPVETEQLTVRIVDEKREGKSKGRRNGHKSGDGKNEEGKGQDAPVVGLPKCILLTKGGHEVKGYEVQPWPSDFSEYDGGLIEDYGEEVVYKINYDNVYHIKYRAQQRGQVSKDVVTEKYVLGMRIMLLGYEHALREILKVKGKQGNGIAEFTDEFRRMAARGAASTVLSLAEFLPKIVDQSTIQEEPE